jgi:DNA-binding beta-propeller fold protein YncE
MKNIIAKNVWRAFGQAGAIIRREGAILLMALLLTAASVASATTVSWVSGGPNNGYPTGAGYVDGDITLQAEYHTPCGLAVDLSGDYLFVADRDNNAVRVLEFDNNTASTLLTFNGPNLVTNLFNKPVGVAIDSSYNIFVLNRGNGTNGNILEFNDNSELVATNAVNLTNAAGFALDGNDNIYVTVRSNTVLEITSPGVSNVVATITNAGASLQRHLFDKSSQWRCYHQCRIQWTGRFHQYGKQS